jgi:phosphoribosylformylglycinamidine (FGAM) synthase PurS component
MRPRNMPLKSRELQQDSIFTSTQFDVLKTNSVDSSASSSRKCEHRAPVTSEELLANPIVKSILQQVDTKNKQVVTSIVPEHVFEKIANQHDGSLEKQFYVVKPICVPGAQTERIDPYPSFNSKNKANQVHKIYHQMLSNHARAPGPKNRGIRSE